MRGGKQSAIGRRSSGVNPASRWQTRSLVLLLWLSLLGDGGAFCAADESSAEGVRRIEDVIYGRKHGMALTLDVFQPAKAHGGGVVYLVNGGWASSKDTPRMQNVQPEYYRAFLERGYVVFAVVTSSQPRFAIPDLMEDVQRAVRFVRTNAERYGVRPDRLGVTGSSSGGHLALCVASMGGPGKADALDPVERVSGAVQAAACFFPPTDFLNYGGPGKNGVGAGPLQPLLVAFGPRALDEQDRQRLGREISPIYFVTERLPPTLIIHGDADDVVPLQQAESFLARAKEAGVTRTRLVVRPGKGHGWPQGSIVWKSEEDMREIVEWFDKFLIP